MSFDDPLVGDLGDEPEDDAPDASTSDLGDVEHEELADVVGDATELSALDRLIAERDEYLDMVRRLQAEFDNYRKRTVRQQTELVERASEGVVERLLPVLDTLDLALTHFGSDGVESNGLLEAFEQVASMLRNTLSQEGLERIDQANVPFDPSIHDAVAHEPRSTPDGEEESGQPHDKGARVAEVMRAGYRLKGRVLRPAMVRVEG